MHLCGFDSGRVPGSCGKTGLCLEAGEDALQQNERRVRWSTAAQGSQKGDSARCIDRREDSHAAGAIMYAANVKQVQIC